MTPFEIALLAILPSALAYAVLSDRGARKRAGAVLADCGPNEPSRDLRVALGLGLFCGVVIGFLQVAKLASGGLHLRDLSSAGPLVFIAYMAWQSRRHRLLCDQGVFWNGWVLPWSQLRSWSRCEDGSVTVTNDHPRLRYHTLVIAPPWSAAASAVLAERVSPPSS